MEHKKIYIGREFYLIGIGGISMSAIAKHILVEGGTVSGSDIHDGSAVRELKRMGVTVYPAHDASHLKGVETVIVNSAIREDNPELLRARELNLKIYSRMEFIAETVKEFCVAVGIAGCHGKTTATAMLSNICREAHCRFLAHIGGEDLRLGNYYFTGRDIFVGEVCEYKRNIDKFPADVACVLNVGYDHADCYSGINEIAETYYAFLDRARTRIINADDEALVAYKDKAITFGLNGNGDYTAEDIRCVDGKPVFTLYDGNTRTEISLGVYGVHNVYNALCSAATARALGIGWESITGALTDFKGIKRRFESIGEVNGGRVICDYAHHPKEILSSIATAEGVTRGRLFIIFQPHTYSRTLALMDEFISCLKGRSRVSIFKEYAARESYDANGSAKALYDGLGTADNYFECEDEIIKYLRGEVSVGDTVLILGAGDIYDRMLRVIN